MMSWRRLAGWPLMSSASLNPLYRLLSRLTRLMEGWWRECWRAVGELGMTMLLVRVVGVRGEEEEGGAAISRE